MVRKIKNCFAQLTCVALVVTQLPHAYGAEVVKTLPAGTRLYLSLEKQVTSRRGEVDVGETVPCRVWRDVEHEGSIIIKGGTPAGCRVDKVKRSNMGGNQGTLSIGGMDTKAVDGQTVMLQGGYNKEGGSRRAAVWTVGLLLFWPALFVPGRAAELPPGTLFDVSTVNDTKLRVEMPDTAPAVTLNLSSITGSFRAEPMLEEFLAQQKPEILKLRVTKDEPLPSGFVIDSVNGKMIDPIPLTLTPATVTDGMAQVVCEAKIKPLAKYFQKGINRFEVAYTEAGARTGTEVVLDIQM